MSTRLFTLTIVAFATVMSLPAQRPPTQRFGAPIATIGSLGPVALLAVGDLDGDGLSDFLCTTNDFGLRGIEARRGSNGDLIWRLAGTTLFSAVWNTHESWLRLDDIDGDGASEVVLATVNGIEVRSGRTGALHPGSQVSLPAAEALLLASASDRTGDGIEDVAIYTQSSMAGSAGTLQIFDPAHGAIISTVTVNRATDPCALALVDDVNGDLVADFAIGDPAATTSTTNPGSVRVVSGVDGALLNQFENFNRTIGFGCSVVSFRDDTNDGVRELAIGMASSGSIPARVLFVDPVRGVQVGEFFSQFAAPRGPRLHVDTTVPAAPALFLSRLQSDPDPVTGQNVVAEGGGRVFLVATTYDPLTMTTGPDSDFEIVGDMDGVATTDFLFAHRPSQGANFAISSFLQPGVFRYGNNPMPTGLFVFPLPDHILLSLPITVSPVGGWYMIGTQAATIPTGFGTLLIDPMNAFLLPLGASEVFTATITPAAQGSTVFAQPIWPDLADPSALVLGPGYRIIL